jgi:hypothetical protein
MADIDFAELKSLKENGCIGRAFKVNVSSFSAVNSKNRLELHFIALDCPQLHIKYRQTEPPSDRLQKTSASRRIPPCDISRDSQDAKVSAFSQKICR